MSLNNKVVLITGGTGSFGNEFVRTVLETQNPKVIRIFSRDELKQWEMEKKFNNDRKLRFFIGDIRDKNRLKWAMDGVDIVVHAAALKQVPFCEYNPFEAIKTNILGAQNIIESAIEHKVKKVLAISTDKAVNPVNLYGATKMAMEKLIIASNVYAGHNRTRLSCVRYGNVVGSRGSVVQVFTKQAETGFLTITDKRMTRFIITLKQGVEFVLSSIEKMQGGEVFVPRIPSTGILSIARAVAPECKYKMIGIRHGEKLHEVLISKDEMRNTVKHGDRYIIEPPKYKWSKKGYKHTGTYICGMDEYNSLDNPDVMDYQAFRGLCEKH
jgi:UDP-N-acetylglucosamine 4,6-dehydratase/5-epimerase